MTTIVTSTGRGREVLSQQAHCARAYGMQEREGKREREVGRNLAYLAYVAYVAYSAYLAHLACLAYLAYSAYLAYLAYLALANLAYFAYLANSASAYLCVLLTNSTMIR